MVRKTREQVWRELDELGEDEVRERLAANAGGKAETGLMREWLTRKERVASELSATAAEVEPGTPTTPRPERKRVGGVVLIALSAAALGYLLARRRRR